MPTAAPAPAPPPVSAPVAAPVPVVTPAPVIPELEIVEDPTPASDLARLFEDVVGDGGSLPGVEMTTSTRGLVISMPEAGSFRPGRADLSPLALSVMADLAERLRDMPNLVRVEGHTDDVPIATAQ